jgi:hypothetical protein
MANENTGSNACPGSSGYGGTTLPRYNGEEATSVGIAPSTSSASAPNNEVNGPRIVDEQMVFNQCGGGYFGSLNDQLAFNSSTPVVLSSWYDYGLGRTVLQRFLVGLDTAAAPITVTLGGGCAGSACTYAALGSSTHVRAVLVSATGNSATGVSNAVTNPTITLTVPAGTYQWVNPATGAVLASGTTTSGSNSFTYSGTFGGASQPTDIYFQADQP